MTANEAVFNSSGPCTFNSMEENADGSWTLKAVISGLDIVWSDSFNNPHTLPTTAEFTVTVPANEVPPNFIRESLWCWTNGGTGNYTVTCTGFHMTA